MAGFHHFAAMSSSFRVPSMLLSAGRRFVTVVVGLLSDQKRDASPSKVCHGWKDFGVYFFGAAAVACVHGRVVRTRRARY